MTTLYLDTEYNGFNGELISLALISPEGHHFYEAKTFKSKMVTNLWVEKNVLPVLRTAKLTPAMFKARFQEFIRRFQNPKIICDWHEDAVHFCSLLSGEEYGSSLDFACEIMILKTPPNAYVSAIPHNALADAQALMVWHTAKK